MRSVLTIGSLLLLALTFSFSASNALGQEVEPANSGTVDPAAKQGTEDTGQSTPENDGQKSGGEKADGGSGSAGENRDASAMDTEVIGNWIVGILCVTLFVIAIIGMARSYANPTESRIQQLGPNFFFWLGMVYLGVLLLAAILKLNDWYSFGVKDADGFIGGKLPVEVPWFGALGAVVISLQGVFQFNRRWDPGYNYWHIARPLIGAVLGVVAFYMFSIIVDVAAGGETTVQVQENGVPTATAETTQPATPTEGVPPEGTPPEGEQPETTGQTTSGGEETPASPPGKNRFIYYILAFIVGYREGTFRELLQRVTDLILRPGDSAPAPTVPSVAFVVAGMVKTEIDFDEVANGEEKKIGLEINNIGTVPVSGPVEVSIAGDAELTLTAGADANNGDMAPNEFRKYDVTFSPSGERVFEAVISVTSSSFPAPQTIKVKGKGT